MLAGSATAHLHTFNVGETGVVGVGDTVVGVGVVEAGDVGVGVGAGIVVKYMAIAAITIITITAIAIYDVFKAPLECIITPRILGGESL